MNLLGIRRTFAVFCCFLAAPLTSSALECPHLLLWTSGSLWAYSAVDCISARKCNVPTYVVLIYDHSVSATGCNVSGTTCTCNLPDAQNNYLYRMVLDSPQDAKFYTVKPDLPVNNRGCSFIDAFNVPIKNTQDYFQCIEFRFQPDPKKPERNMRIAIKLEAKPSKFLVNDDSKLNDADNPKYLVRKVGDNEIKYQVLRIGKLTLEDEPKSAPDSSTPEQTPPAPEPTPEPAKEEGVPKGDDNG